jgi:hypothetical protein
MFGILILINDTQLTIRVFDPHLKSQMSKLDWQVTACLIKKLTGIIGRKFGKILFLIVAKTLRPN